MEDLHEKYAVKEQEFKEKYADVINDLAVKYGVDLGVGYDMLCGIARGVIYDVEPLYVAEIDYNKDEMVKDYQELLNISIEIAKNEGNL